mgnify:CR=1 FL=1
MYYVAVRHVPKLKFVKAKTIVGVRNYYAHAQEILILILSSGREVDMSRKKNI